MGRRSAILRISLLVLAASFVAGSVVLLVNLRAGRQPIEIEVSVPTPSAVPRIKVYVSGAVNSEGVYDLPSGSRAEDAIAAAGGFAPEANRQGINLAQRLRDADWISVPRVSDKVSVTVATPRPSVVNINFASAEELAASLEGTGVGPAKAKAIVDFRSVHGPFLRAEDVIKVPGIGTAIFTRIKDLIVVE